MSRLPPFAAVQTLALLVVLVVAPGSSRAFAASGPSLSTLRAKGAAEVRNVFVRAPQSAADGQSLQVLIALHGMGGNGNDFGGALAAQADANGWLIVAPTIVYGDWTNPDQIAKEDPALIAWLCNEINHLSERTGYAVQPRVLFFGHSRGAQLALRFTEIHPEIVAGVAAISAGTYTLPVSTDPRTGQALNYPFGIANLAQTDGGQGFDANRFDSVPIWIGVGGADTNDGDVPDAWDPYIGVDRLTRAQSFAEALLSLGANASLTVFPNAGHALTDDMRGTACAALAAAVPDSAQTRPSASAT